jgi:hypothetical protein
MRVAIPQAALRQLHRTELNQPRHLGLSPLLAAAAYGGKTALDTAALIGSWWLYYVKYRDRK